MRVSIVIINSLEQIKSSIAIGFQVITIDRETDSLKPNGPEGTMFVSIEKFRKLFPGEIESALGKCISFICYCRLCENFCVHAVQANEYICDDMERICEFETSSFKN